MKDKYRLFLIISLFPIVIICPALLNLIEYYPSKFILNLFYFGTIILCYGILFIWCYFVVKFIRGE